MATAQERVIKAIADTIYDLWDASVQDCEDLAKEIEPKVADIYREVSAIAHIESLKELVREGIAIIPSLEVD